MLMFMLAGVGLMLAFLAILGHHNQQRALQEWEMILNPEGTAVYDEVCGQLLWNRDILQRSYEAAAVAHAQLRPKEMAHHLDLAARIVGECSDGIPHLLRNLALLARYAAAIAPVPPLRPSGFRSRELATLAGLHTLGHHLLITTRERLHFRLTVLRCAVRAAGALLLRATWRTREAPQETAGWARVGVLRADMGTLTDESLASLRVVLASLAAVRRPVAEGERKTA